MPTNSPSSLKQLLRPLLVFALCLLSLAAFAQKEFALHDGDTVVFLGDSITAAQTYGKVIENYTLLRFPERKVRFFNAGKGGDTAQGSLKRLEHDVFDQKPTVLIVAFGINDIGWGMKANQQSKQAYLEGIRSIIEQCKKRQIRVFICSAPITSTDPEKSEKDFLQSMCDEGMALSRSLGEHSIDVQRSMRDIQRKVWKEASQTTNPKSKPTLHAEDGVHLNDYGQIAMAYAILKGLGAPAEVSSATLDARKACVLSAHDCEVSELTSTPAELRFTRRDARLPLNLGLVGLLSYRWVPIPEELNRYMTTITGLEPGQYEIRVNERPVGKYSSEQLQRGVNLGSATPDAWEPGGPWDAQAAVLRPLTDARSDIVLSARSTQWYTPENPNRDAMTSQSRQIVERLEELQKLVANPVGYHFVVRKLK